MAPRPTPDAMWRTARRIVTDPRAVGVARAAPRAAAFMARTVAGRHRDADRAAVVAAEAGGALGLPALLGLGAQVLLDEVVISAMRNPRLFPAKEDFARAGDEIWAAHTMWKAEGWLDEPESYHAAPAEPRDWSIYRERALGQRYERLCFESPYRPHAGEPGRDRWLAHRPNATFHAYVLRHPGPPRPWLVCVHGFGMGRNAVMDMRAFRAQRLHRDLGLNLILPVLPLHGARQDPGTDMGEGLMSINLIDTLHGMAQAAAEVRAVLRWARGRGDAPVGVYGISLGGYVTALVASLEVDLACAVAGIPAVDMPDLFRRHSPPAIRRRAFDSGALGPETDRVMSVVSPLAMGAKPPWERRFVFAGLGDRMSNTDQAVRLWEHWDRPRVEWYPGGHIGFFFAAGVARFLEEALAESFALEASSSSASGM